MDEWEFEATPAVLADLGHWSDPWSTDWLAPVSGARVPGEGQGENVFAPAVIRITRGTPAAPAPLFQVKAMDNTYGIDPQIWAGWASELSAASGARGSVIGDAPYGGVFDPLLQATVSNQPVSALGRVFQAPQLVLNKLGLTSPATQAAAGGGLTIILIAVAAVLLLRRR